MTNAKVATKYSDELRKSAEIITKHLKYSGQLGFDFIVDDASDVYILECNPRITTGITLATKQHSVYDILFMNKKAEITKRNKVKAFGLMFIYARYVKSKDIFKLIRVFFTHRDILFTLKDPMPCVKGFLDYLKRNSKGENKTIANYEEYLSYDMQYNGGYNGL